MSRAALLASILLASGYAVGSSDAGGRASARSDVEAVRVISVFAVNVSGKRVRKPPAGIAGDVVVGTDRLVNAAAQFGKPKGAVVGKDRYRTVFATASVASVEVTATLPGGTIQARGDANFRRASNVIRVVGGTGAFSGAKGTAEERALANGQTLNVYRLQAG